MLPYIDIHTHHLQNHPEVLEILNLRAGEDRPEFQASHVSFGVHPWDADQPERVRLIDQASDIEHLTAIGECGLDKFQGGDLAKQTSLFKQHIELSEKLNVPVVIHCVGYFNELMALRKEGTATRPWIIHGFAGHPQLAEQLIKAGFFLSFGEALMQADSKAAGALKALAADQWFLETDESEQSIQSIYQRAADIGQISLSQLKAQLHQNFLSTFAGQNL
ncbi:TatD family hydrolase [Geofilum rubicundum]|uniref:Putative deoxyribonuclease YjjV n=1 Tax=Geofilum rubicundum JCM 15548 TaxID=1236989 RepID=A0A0E9LWG2_9BACT|nr:TatD family hydrolase [Geofilum rubicundum]GAO29902.1 putative deoxyribonuclease YjjV [Geofilum rubicundum JCM 15548]